MSLVYGGLDLSLTQTGRAVTVEGELLTDVFRPKGKGYGRLNEIVGYCLHGVAHCDVVGVEDCITHGKFVNMPLIGAWWIVARELTNAGILWVPISPTVLKKYATGKGVADKFVMFKAALQRLGADAIETPDEADAAWLAAACADQYGEPLCEMPQLNRSALAARNKKGLPVVDWPDAPPRSRTGDQLEGTTRA